MSHSLPRHGAAAALAAALLCLAAAPAHAAPAPLGAQTHTTITGSLAAETVNAGDMNGDGRDDLATFPDCGSTMAVVFGASAGGTVNTEALGSRGLTITGLGADPYDCGRKAVALGDVNGDGRDDLAIQSGGGRFGSDVPTTSTWVVYGRPTGGTIDLATLGTGGLTFALTTPGTTIRLSRAVRVGDVNGDGRDDIGVAGYLSSEAPGPVLSTRKAAGVVFGRAGGGTVNLASPTLGGLVITPTGTQPGNGDVGGITPAGDVNGDGRADVLVNGLYLSQAWHLVYGRATSSLIDLSNLGSAGVRLPGATPVNGALDPVGDLNGDGIPEQAVDPGFSTPASRAVLMSTRSAPTFDLWAVSRRLTVSASLSSTLPHLEGVGDQTGDGRDDVLATATYEQKTTTPYIGAAVRPLSVRYMVGRTSPGAIDLRTAAPRVAGLPSADARTVGVRFTGAARSQLATNVGDRVLVQEVGPAPADTTPPNLTSVAFDRLFLSRSCSQPCSSLDTAGLSFTVNEDAYMELTIRRGTTVVGTASGSAPGGRGDYVFLSTITSFNSTTCPNDTFVGRICSRLPAGVYTATLRATDLAGNRSATRTATIILQ